MSPSRRNTLQRSFAASLLAIAVTLTVSCGGQNVDSNKRDGLTTTTGSPDKPLRPTTSNPDRNAGAATPPAQVGSSRFAAAVCDGDAQVTSEGRLNTDKVSEASGIVASRINPGIWWVNNDSGDSPRLFAFDERGDLRAILTISGADAIDWEDLAIDGGTIFVADTGDGKARRDDVTIYSVSEPTLATPQQSTRDAGAPETLTVPATAISLTYPDGAHDTEALAYDPIDKALVAISKDWSLQGRSTIYRTSLPFDAGEQRVFEQVGVLKLPVGTLVTGADISPDGTLIAVRSYTSVALFERPVGTDLATALASEPCDGPGLLERQGESIGFSADGASYMTVSEGSRPTLHRTHR